MFSNLILPDSPLVVTSHLAEASGDTDINKNVTDSEPTGNYTNGTALIAEGPMQIIQPKPTGNYTNGTALGTEGPRQIIIDRPALSQVAPPNQSGGNIPNAITGNVINIPNINITKEQAAKAEQEANVMVNAYYEKLEQEKQKEKEQAAALAAAAQVNQTNNNASQVEGSLEDNATALADETEDDTDVEAEEEDEAEDDEENDNEDGNNDD